MKYALIIVASLIVTTASLWGIATHQPMSLDETSRITGKGLGCFTPACTEGCTEGQWFYEDEGNIMETKPHRYYLVKTAFVTCALNPDGGTLRILDDTVTRFERQGTHECPADTGNTLAAGLHGGFLVGEEPKRDCADCN